MATLEDRDGKIRNGKGVRVISLPVDEVGVAESGRVVSEAGGGLAEGDSVPGKVVD